MTQMRRCLFFQIVMSLMKRRTVKQSKLQLIRYLPLVGHLQMKDPRIWKHKPCKHQLSLMVTLVSSTFPVYSSQRQYVFLICATVCHDSTILFSLLCLPFFFFVYFTLSHVTLLSHGSHVQSHDGSPDLSHDEGT